MASALAEEECEACTSDDEPLTETEYGEYLAELDDDVWTVVDDHHLDGAYEFEDFRDALEKLTLNDASLQYEPESSDALGFGDRKSVV